MEIPTLYMEVLTCILVQDARAIYMAKWEIIAREFLTGAYISMNPA